MKRIYWVLGALLLVGAFNPLNIHPSRANAQEAATPVAGMSCAGSDGNGLIVYLDVELRGDDEDAGDVQSAFVVFAPDGTELYRVPIDGVPTFYPLHVGCTVVVNDGGDQPLLFNPATGELRPLAVPEDMQDRLYPVNSWLQRGDEQRWAILWDGEIGHLLLVDTVSAEVFDLVAVVNDLRSDDEIVVPMSVVLTPDESSLLLATDRDTWVMSTDNPRDARLVPDAMPGRVALSDDGEQIAYVAEPIEDRFQVMTERLDGSGRQVVTDADQATTVIWVPGTDGHQLLVINSLGGPDALTSFVDGKAQVFDLELPGHLFGRPNFSPSGRQVVFRVDDDDVAWVWLDLDTGEGRRLTDLDGYPFPYSGQASGSRWLTFFPADTPSVEPGAVVRGLNLETGEVSDLLTFDFDETYVGISPTANFGVSGDGRYVIVNDLGEEYPRFWLLDAAQGTSKEFKGHLAQSFSPDNSQLIVSGPTDSTDNRVWETAIMSVDGQIVLTLAESVGRGGLWMPA